MRDINEPSYSQSSRTKFKQRIAGGAVLLIVLGIFLPFIFNHSHMKTAANQEAESTAPQQQTVSANVTAPASAPAAAVQAPDPAAANVNPAVNQAAAPAPAPEQAQTQAATPDVNSVANDPNQAVVPPVAADSGLTPTPNESATAGGTAPAQMVAPEPVQNSAPVQQSAPPAAQPSDVQAQAPQAPIAPPTVQRVEPVQQPKPAKPVAAAPAAVTNATSASGHWLVQVGSFNQAANAQQLVSKLHQHGFSAFAKREPSGMVRVYIPAGTQAQAAKIQNQISDQLQLTSFIRERHR